MNYKEIKPGDLLIWDHGTGSVLDTIGINIIKLMTVSKYVHVGIAFKVYDRLFVIEAVPGSGVRIMPVEGKDTFYYIPMNIKWKPSYANFLFNKLGESYSFINDIKAYFGEHIDENNHRWQCVELAHSFYKFIGIDLGYVFTPAVIVDKLSSLGYHVIPSSNLIKDITNG